MNELPTLKQLRDRLGMTQEQLATELGISRRSIVRHETGERLLRLTFSQIKRMQELLKQAGLSVEDLPDDIE